ncbi:tail fiber domain-containing protein [Salmonella enterica subsp. enterica serovar Litchfield]|nr:tail fiber domain-containing protein [Salmonella enterica subsp. enterica serovar Litchfield]EDG6129919.1 tail fiber domain-containing protein [Salmonella enterica subsp. enterica serovar Litchfield]EDH7929742.1 tail fiber domain-containing protein [Salmonella enterica subsp. enterica serovar Litchfield]EGW8109594.1 tail fiber domain-containing protein [Salmonella enterica subsp. enterica serovar 4,[5],12:i:-]ELL3535705.1 tail fiber domain-containing protein [Salmonella enterica]
MQSIQFKRTSIEGKKPTPESIQVGEIALNLKDHVIFTKDKEHKVVQISVSPETHTALENKVDSNKKELDQTIALNDQNINAKVDDIKTETDATISANDKAINTKVDKIKRETDATIKANKETAASDLATAKDELNTTIETNKTAAALATQELDTRINAKVDGIKERTDATIQANDTAIHEKVDLIKANTDRTIAANAEHAQNQLEETFNHLTGVIEANKEEAAEAVTALSGTVEAKDTAIHKKVDDNKTHTDGEITRLESRIDMIDGSSDGKFIKKDTNTKTEAWLVSRTANYSNDIQAMDYLRYFGAYRVNGLDNWGEYTGMILNVPHALGKAHGRGFSFQYGSAGSQVRTYGFDANGEKAFSHRMYHEGDKPTPAELNVYSKEEVDRLFQKSIHLGHAAGWYKIASVNLPQIGTTAFIRLYGGNGFNAGTVAQTNVYELVFRSSNANPHGLTFTVYQSLDAFDNEFCAVHTDADNFDIYAKYFDYSAYVMAEYGAAGATISIHDYPERFDDKPEEGTVYDALRVNMFNSHRNRGTLNFNVNGQATYDIAHMSDVATEGLNHLRQFRSSASSMIWGETIHNNYYRLSTGGGLESQEMLIVAQGNGRGGLFVGGRFTADSGNDAFKINYVPASESAMLQIWERGTSNLNAYFGYGSANTTELRMYNRIGDIKLTTKDGRGLVNVEGGLSVSGNQIVMYATDPNNNSSSPLYIQNWGNAALGRPIVFEIKDNTGYHFFSQRASNGNIQFETAGQMIVRNNLDVYGANGINIRSDTNRHIWFQDNAGAEKVVIYADNDGSFKIRTTAQQHSTRFGDGMLHTTGAPTVGTDRGLLRGYVGGGAWDAWRDRAAGILIDCPDSQNQAYSIWKATHWGAYHIAAMGVHAGGGSPSVGMHVGAAAFWWDAAGTFNASGNINCNDVYIRSDSRLKINVENYEENATDKVNKLTVKTYDKVKSLKDREVVGHEIGIIAQDLKEILPEAVTLTNIGSPEEVEEVYTISNSAVNALLIKAVQEMSKRIEYLESLVK